MKRYVENKDVTASELSNWVGVTFHSNVRGVILYIGDTFHIICNDTIHGVNVTCGCCEQDGISILDTIERRYKHGKV